MKNQKYMTFFSAGILALTFQKVNNLNLVLPTPTPTATIKPLQLFPGVKNLGKVVLEFTNKRAELSNVKVTTKDSSSITVDNGGVSIKVDALSNTHFRRRFWGNSNLNEISVGDSVDVIGRWTSEDKTEIKAVVIRNISIQKRFGVFFGTVKTITDTGFTLTTIQRGDETVILNTAKLINRKGQSITSSDIQVGDLIRVRGLWDSANFTINEITEVKDFNLPMIPSPTP